MFFDIHPALVILFLQCWCGQRKACRLDHLTCLQHERHGVVDLAWMTGVDLTGLLESGAVGTVSGHAIVQAGAARAKACRLGIILAMDESHELAGDVAMEPGRPESIFGRQPARRKD